MALQLDQAVVDLPRLTRAKVVAAAITLADREGFGAVTIRRVAAELDSRPMSLYAYIGNKDELVRLMVDAAAIDSLIEEGELPGDLPGALRSIAQRSRGCFHRHPWMAAALGTGGAGLGTLNYLDRSLAGGGAEVDDETRRALVRVIIAFAWSNAVFDCPDAGFECGLDWLIAGAEAAYPACG